VGIKILGDMIAKAHQRWVKGGDGKVEEERV
jgi:hypothetical protein